MKLKYFFASIVATLALAVSCQKEADNFLNEIKASSSYLAFPAEGGEITYTFTTTDAWEWDLINTKDEKDADGETVKVPVAFPEWITASAMSGAAGENKVVLTATEATDTRVATIAIKCAGKKQRINVIQATEAAEPVIMTVSEAIAWAPGLADGSIPEQNVYVKGIVCRIDEISTSYGNATYYLSDDGSFKGSYGADGKSTDGANWFEVYRGYWLNGAKFTTGNEFSVGDEIIVSGLIMSYKGTPETKQNASEVYKYTPSLIGVDGPDYGTVKNEEGEEVALTAIPAEGGKARVTVSSKVTPVLLTSDADWLTVSDVESGDVYVLTAAANEYTATRTATITIKAPGAVKTVAVSQEGIPATGATVTEIIAMADDSQVETLESTVIAKTGRGVVIYDGTTALYAYSTDKFVDVQIGDNVKIFGKKTTYNGVPEITDVTEVIVYSNGNTFEIPAATDITAQAGDYTAAKAEFIKLTGTLSINKEKGYYNLALDAFPEGDKQGSINQPLADLGLDALDGKKITVTGWFNGLGSSGKFINMIATKVVEFVDNPKGTATNPYSASEIAAEILAGNIPEEDVYIKGIVSAVLYTASADHPTATFWISDDGTAYGVSADKKSTTEPTKDFECYSVKWFGNADWAEGNGQVTVGDEVIVCGKTTVYSGVAETSSKKAWLYSVNYVKTAGLGLGSAEFPFNVAGAEEVIDYQQAEMAAAKAAEAATPVFKDVCVGGKISAILYDPSADHPTCSFWISDDGTAYGVSADKKSTTEPTKDFECYSVKWFGNTDWAEGNAKPAVGDEVIVKGQLTLYGTTYETASKKAWIYSLNGATE